MRKMWNSVDVDVVVWRVLCSPGCKHFK